MPTSTAKLAGRFLRRYAAALAGSPYLFTAGILSPRHRAVIDDIARHFGHDDRVTALLPAVAASDVTCDRTPVEVLHPFGRDGNVALEELVVLNRLVRERAPLALLEIGTFDGRTTANLAANSPEGAVVYTLDLPPGESDPLRGLEAHERRYARKPTPGRLLRGSELERKVVQLLGDSAAFDFSPYEGALDFVFVDGSHTYEYARADSLTALRLLRRGRGVIVWHDYHSWSWQGVTRALNELRRIAPEFKDLRRVEGTTLALLEL